jgi:hypothetical protein
MTWAKDQLREEANHQHLVAFLRSGGTLEVGEDLSNGAFARLRKGNRTAAVVTVYRDLAAILKEMDSLARNQFGQET